MLIVSGSVGGGGAGLGPSLTLRGGAAGELVVADPAGTVAARDGRGRVVASSPIAPVFEEGAAATSAPFAVSFSDAARIASVTVRAAGGRPAVSRRSRHRPTVKFLSLPRTLSQTKRVTLRWRARDRDRRSRLTSTLLTRAGGGRFETVATGLRGRRLALDPAALPAGGKIVLRLLVSDGFNTATTTSRTLRVR